MMRCSEINLKNLREIDLEMELEAVEEGSGTYEEIEKAVNDGKISLLKDSEGNAIGISYDSGKTGAEDTLEGMKFAKRFFGHNVMAYIYKALTGKEYIVKDNAKELPVELYIDIDELGGVINEKTIANYLRDTFDHYLSGKTDKQFEWEDEVDEFDNTIFVYDIAWGRKR